MKTNIKNVCEKHPGSKTILKIENDPLPVRKENRSITLYRCYFHINKECDHILLVDDRKNDDGHRKVTEVYKRRFCNISFGWGH